MQPVATVRRKFTASHITTTVKTVVGGIYMVDHNAASALSTTRTKAWTTFVISTATNGPRGIPVVCEAIVGYGESVSCVVSGPCKALVYGAAAVGDRLAVATSGENYLVTTTTQADVRGFFEGITQSAVTTAVLCDIILAGHPNI
jgi:hypothetical protein